MSKRHIRILRSLTKPRPLIKRSFEKTLDVETNKGKWETIFQSILDKTKHLLFKPKNLNKTAPVFFTALLICILVTYQNCNGSGGSTGNGDPNSLSTQSLVDIRGPCTIQTFSLNLYSPILESCKRSVSPGVVNCSGMNSSMVSRIRDELISYANTKCTSFSNLLSYAKNQSVYCSSAPYSYTEVPEGTPNAICVDIIEGSDGNSTMRSLDYSDCLRTNPAVPGATCASYYQNKMDRANYCWELATGHYPPEPTTVKKIKCFFSKFIKTNCSKIS